MMTAQEYQDHRTRALAKVYDGAHPRARKKGS